MDCQPEFWAMEPHLSVRKPLDVPEVLIWGQDETVVKQFSFSAKCWYDNKGATKLLPKIDGYAFMVSGPFHRKFGLGVPLEPHELTEINDRRSTNEFKHYIRRDSAMQVYGTTEKKTLTKNHQLLTLFEHGQQHEGYWNYNHIALQMEDVYDILSVRFPHCDFAILIDQSSGHRKRRRMV